MVYFFVEYFEIIVENIIKKMVVCLLDKLDNNIDLEGNGENLIMENVCLNYE